MHAIDYGIVGLFFVVIFAAGAYFYKWIGEADDFYVAGRKLTPFILAATLTATNVNLYSFVSQAGAANASGIGMIWQTWTGNMAMVIAGLFILPVMRRLRIRTVPEFLEVRYGRSARMLAAAVVFLRLAFWLGIVVTLAVNVAQAVTSIETVTIGSWQIDSWHFWIAVFAVITVVYTVMGGMWSVALTDVLQFVLMMVGALIVLPLIMSKIGWWPGLKAALPEGHLTLVKSTGRFNWLFMLSIAILGIQWASTDQGLIQRAFSASNTKSVAKGMVLAGIITTPFAFLWILPGLASRVLLAQNGLEVAADKAIPVVLPMILGPGLLGLILCGFLASQMSTLDSNLSAAATLFVNDIYGRFHKKAPSPRALLRVVRIVTIIAGVFMVLFAYFIRNQASTVDAYLWLIAILDMPLFVIVVVFGFFSPRATLPGAIIGYLLGAAGGFITIWVTAGGGSLISGNAGLATFASAGAAVLGVVIGSYFGREPNGEALAVIERAKRTSDEEKTSGDEYHIWPSSLGGRISVIFLLAGFAVFLGGALAGRWDWQYASVVAVCGMVAVFAGGLVRLVFD